MLDYNLSLLALITSSGLAISFAFHHKMWRYCLSGFALSQRKAIMSPGVNSSHH